MILVIASLSISIIYFLTVLMIGLNSERAVMADILILYILLIVDLKLYIKNI